MPGGGARAPQGVERQPRLVERPDGAVEAKVTLHANDPMVPAAGLTAHMDAHCTIRAYFDPSLLPVEFWVTSDHEAFPSYEL